jgi:thiamine biosynthesis protein ThiS
MISAQTTSISITVNGDARETVDGRSIAELLGDLGLNPHLVVVEHNRVIVERKTLNDVKLHAGDVLELVHFVGGG